MNRGSQPKHRLDITADDAPWDEALMRLERLGPASRLLLRRATILSMDEHIGDMLSGDVLIAGDTVQDVAPDLGHLARDSDVVEVDLEGMVLIPGLVDAHRHCWQGQFRRFLSDGDVSEYAAVVHDSLAPSYRSHDVYAGTLISLLGLLSAGITTVLDYCHNARSRAHADAAFEAYQEAGVRVVHAFAGPYAGPWEEQWPHDAVRLREVHCRGTGNLLSVRLAVDHLQQGLTPTAAVAFARQNGFAVTMDGIIGAVGNAQIGELAANDALGPDLTLIHCTGLNRGSWDAIAAAGAPVTLATTTDQMLVGMADGRPPIIEALRHGIRPSLSTDVEVAVAGDLFSQMRATLAIQRLHVSEMRDRGVPAPDILTQRDVLEFTTVQAARAIGLVDQIGSITPGKSADIVAIRGDDVGNLPLNSAVGTVVQGADSGTVDMVIVGGRVRKWRGRLVGVDLDNIRNLVYESRDRIAREAGLVIDPLGLSTTVGTG